MGRSYKRVFPTPPNQHWVAIGSSFFSMYPFSAHISISSRNESPLCPKNPNFIDLGGTTTRGNRSAVFTWNHLATSLNIIFLRPSGVARGYCRSVHSISAAAHRCTSESDGSRSSCNSSTLHPFGASQSHAQDGFRFLTEELRITRLAPESALAHTYASSSI